MSATPIKALLVEDNPGDVRLIEEALRQDKLLIELKTVGDGVEAMAFLRHEGPYAKEFRPDLILLDLNLPRKDGREMLAELHADADLRTIPVAVLTSSTDRFDIDYAYDLNCACYITKPIDLGQFVEVVQSIDHFYFTIVAKAKA
jgi:CheY-like chemotaxis protein